MSRHGFHDWTESVLVAPPFGFDDFDPFYDPADPATPANTPVAESSPLPPLADEARTFIKENA